MIRMTLGGILCLEQEKKENGTAEAARLPAAALRKVRLEVVFGCFFMLL